MPRKSYTPPFESPPEEEFFKALSPLLKKNATLIPQYEIETDWGKFRIDFMILYKNTKIAIECDGESVHGKNAQIYDYWRDIICLGKSIANSIYRFSGKGLNSGMPGIVYLFYKAEPDIFNQKAKKILESQNPIPATELFKLQVLRQNNYYEEIDPGLLQVNPSSGHKIKVKKTSEIGAEAQKIYNFLIENKGRRINSIIYKYNKKKTLY